VNIGGLDHDAAWVLLHGHDPIERMLGLFQRLMMAGQVNQLVAVGEHKITAEGHDARGIVIQRATTGRAELLV
jgi:hypothetical protein